MSHLLPTLAVLLPGLGALLATLAGYGLPGPRTPHTQAHTSHAAPDHHAAAPWTLPDTLAATITTVGVILAAICAWATFLGLNSGTLHASSTDWFTWISTPTWHVTFGLMLDKLSATMLIVVTTVSACVHVYSVGYMAEDPSKRRFFIYLSLFTLAMLLLVTAPNLLQMFLGWEGVGVMSYLLIGFWHQKESANAAAMKAFIVNRVADAAMLVGLFLMLQLAGSLTYADIFAQTPALAASHGPLLVLSTLLMFGGAMGKSAQFGLHTWLPDAMEGPTPVSALIHAATMVTAGVFLLCRMSPVFEATPETLQVVGWVGALTALFAATVGLTQTDIKRVIAYSTCSQLGYMFFAIGVSAYPAAMFHLTTHAFFKALLFLGAGSVIHGLHHEQNIFHMGGLKKALPITYGLMWMGSLALAGIPPFAGFFSKDLILESAAMAGTPQGIALYVIGTGAAILTAIYSFRVLFYTFEGAPMSPKKEHTKAIAHAHESPSIMLIPLLPLALGALGAGWYLQGMDHLGWWQGAIHIAESHPALENAHHINPFLKWLPLELILPAIVLAWVLFTKKRHIPARLAQTFKPLYAFSLNKWYIDELYDAVWVKPTRAVATLLATVVDKTLIDGTVNGVAQATREGGQTLRHLTTGYVFHYAFAMVAGVVGLLAFIVWKM